MIEERRNEDLATMSSSELRSALEAAEQQIVYRTVDVVMLILWASFPAILLATEGARAAGLISPTALDFGSLDWFKPVYAVAFLTIALPITRRRKAKAEAIASISKELGRRVDIVDQAQVRR
jgi:bacteriorhodopsin